jgi:hypothetical protein
MSSKWWLVPPALLVLWIASDMAIVRHSPLTRFDGHEVGRLETAMWRSYYGHQPVRLFGQLLDLMRHQYHLPFWRASLAAWHAAHAAVVFQRGHNRGEYELTLPDLVDYYAIIRRSGDIPFSVEKTARLELEWWIVHRDRAMHAPGDLENSLAALQAAIYRRPASLFRDHASARARAMLLRDDAQAHGGVADQDWKIIGLLLDSSWVLLERAVAPLNPIAAGKRNENAEGQ